MTRQWKIPEMGETLGDLLERLGNVPLDRIPLCPLPGTAKERDVIAARRTPERWLFELVDRVLVLKAPGLTQSILSVQVGSAVSTYLHEHDLGPAFSASAMYRLRPGLVRIPDFSYISWDRLPRGKVPDVEIARFVPELVVELPRPSNTPEEMNRKIREWFEAGVRLVWLVRYPDRTAVEYRSPSKVRHITEDNALSGGDVLPGLTVPLRPVFAALRRRKGSQ